MLLDFLELYRKYDLKVRDVIHIGAHTAEEAPIYSSLGIDRVLWIEGNLSLLGPINDSLVAAGRTKDRVLFELIGDEDDKIVNFNITNLNGLSSSVFQFGSHTEFSPEIVFERTERRYTTTLDSLLSSTTDWDFNMLNMDIQGAEMLALRGATTLLPKLDVVMTEVNNTDVYVGCAKVWEIDELLGAHGLKRIETYWVEGQGWGDALYIRTT